MPRHEPASQEHARYAYTTAKLRLSASGDSSSTSSRGLPNQPMALPRVHFLLQGAATKWRQGRSDFNGVRYAEFCQRYFFVAQLKTELEEEKQEEITTFIESLSEEAKLLGVSSLRTPRARAV